MHEATELLEELAADRALVYRLEEADRIRLLNAAGDVFCPDVDQRRQQSRSRKRRERVEQLRHDEGVLSETGIRKARTKPVFTTPNLSPPRRPRSTEPSEALEPQHCYVCKQHYSRIHHFYDQLCPPCAELNWRKRTETAHLTGRVALLTGGRVKIGYQAAIKLLRSGARVIVTTRFPTDAALRYSRERDFDAWSARLRIFGVDLVHTPTVEAFCEHLAATEPGLDFIINNACQTVRRPDAFYRHMLEQEQLSTVALPAGARPLLGGRWLPAPATSELAQGAGEVELFPAGALDADLQQVDLREHNSWRMRLAEVPTLELVEAHLVNAIAPFVLTARLKELMLRTPRRDKHVVNVSAMEGQFYKRWKTTRHPHTNMAKAALNMMTRTSAADYHADGIHMNSVDTGWVTDEDPVHLAERKLAEQRFHPPLDIVDGAARIVDPIISGVNSGEHVWGQFLKDYHPADW
ncbi:MAG: SDR family NAD(P)-dependent oxidoreductase [Acidimicrobiales bacterium]